MAREFLAWLADRFVTSGLPAKLFPQLTLGFMGICAVIVGYNYLVGGGTGDDEGETVFADSVEAWRGALMLVMAALFILIWRKFGFVPMAILLGPVSLLAMGLRNPIIYVVVLALTGLTTVFFTYGLSVRLM